jgi:hypothetical protein
MPRPLLPPRGVFVPASILYDKSITSAVRDTWIQLRGLAYGQLETPSLSFPQLSEILDKSQSTLYGHMTILRARDALRWRSARDGTFIVSFPEAIDGIQDSENLEKPDSLTPPDKSPKSTRGRKELQSPEFQKSGKSTRKEKPPTIPENVMKPFVNTLADVTGADLKLNYGRLAKEAKDLHNAGYTAQQVAMVYGKGQVWYTHDWRGQKGKKPEIGQIRHTISELLENQNNPPPQPKNGATPDEPNSFRAAIMASKEKFKHGDA